MLPKMFKETMTSRVKSSVLCEVYPLHDPYCGCRCCNSCLYRTKRSHTLAHYLFLTQMYCPEEGKFAFQSLVGGNPKLWPRFTVKKQSEHKQISSPPSCWFFTYQTKVFKISFLLRFLPALKSHD